MELSARAKPSILAANTIAQTRLFRIEELELRFSNGVGARYERLIGTAGGAVMVVPLASNTATELPGPA